MGVLCVIGLLALMNNNVYWIFLKNSKYIYTQILYSFVGRDTFKATLCPTHYNSNSKKKTLVRTIQDDYTTDDQLSITERCDKSIRHSSLVLQTGAIVDTATHSTHNSLVVSKTNRLTQQCEYISAPSPYKT